MTTQHRALIAAPAIVLLPSEDIGPMVTTFESVVGLLADADISVVRTGIAALDVTSDLMAGIGMSLVAASALDGFAAMTTALDRHFGVDPWCYLVAGETLSAEAAAALASGGQLVAADHLPWLESPGALQAPRVRAGGAVRRADAAVTLPSPRMPASWTACFAADIHSTFGSLDDLYDDLSLLAHLGHLDGALLRARDAWTQAGGPTELRLVRAATELSWMMGVPGHGLRASARWFALEPEPYVAYAYVRGAMNAVPFDLIDRLLAQIPPNCAAEYRDGLLRASAEDVLAVRALTERSKTRARRARDGFGAEARTPGTAVDVIKGALKSAFVLGTPPSIAIDVLHVDDLEIAANAVDVWLPPEFTAATLAALHARAGATTGWTRTIEMFVGSRGDVARTELDALDLPHGRRAHAASGAR